MLVYDGSGTSTDATVQDLNHLVNELRGALDDRKAKVAGLTSRLQSQGHGDNAPVPGSNSGAGSVSAASTARMCERQALFHGRTAQEMNTTFRERGVVSWIIVDAFVMRDGNPCGWRNPCPDQLPAVAVEIMARIYKAAPYNLTQKFAKQRRRKEYAAIAANRSVAWECTFATGEKTRMLDTVVDGDMHTLIVRCPIPKSVLDVGTDNTGRLKVTVGLRASDKNTDLLVYSGISACSRDLVPLHTYMGACVMFQEMSPLRTARTVAMWTRFMIYSGFSFVALYLDPVGDGEALEASIQTALAKEIETGQASIVMFHMNGRYSLQTQSAQQNHCQWRFRGRSRWIAQVSGRHVEKFCCTSECLLG